MTLELGRSGLEVFDQIYISPSDASEGPDPNPSYAIWKNSNIRIKIRVLTESCAEGNFNPSENIQAMADKRPCHFTLDFTLDSTIECQVQGQVGGTATGCRIVENSRP